MRRHPRAPGSLALASTLALAAAAHSAPDARAQEPQAPPFADAPDAPKVPPRPETRTWTVVAAPYTFTFDFKPGIAVKGALAEIEMMGLETPKTPDPKWGSTVPFVNADLVAEHLSAEGAVLKRYVMHPVPLATGKYAFHLTPAAEGIQGLRVVGTLADGRKVRADVKLPVDVWPLPKELEGSGDTGGAARRTVVKRPGTN